MTPSQTIASWPSDPCLDEVSDIIDACLCDPLLLQAVLALPSPTPFQAALQRELLRPAPAPGPNQALIRAAIESL